MIQTVGIRFQAEGLDTVARQMKVLASGVKSLVTGIKKLENLDTSKAITNLNRLALGMGNAASKLTMAAYEINAAVTAFTGANAVMGRGRPGGVGGGDTHGSSKKTDLSWYSPAAILSTTGNLAKYSVAFGALYGAKAAVSGYLGAGREDMQEAAFRLTGVGITDRADKRKIERSVTEFLAKNPYMGTIAEGVAGAAEIASAIPFGDKRYPTLNMDMLTRMNKMNMVYAKLAEMTPKQAADSGILAMNALIAHKPKEEQGEYYTQPGKMEGFYDQILGMQQKAIDISKLTGQDIAEFNKHALPLLLSRGWDYQSALAVAASEKDIGLRVSSGGRAMKNLYTHEDKAGLLMALGDPDEKYAKKVAAMKKAAQLEEGFKYFQKVKEFTKGDAYGMLEMGADAQKRAKARGVNVQKLISAEFAQYFEELFNNDFIQFMRDKRQQIGQQWLTGVQREMLTDKSQEDENPLWGMLKQRIDALQKKLGDTPNDGSLNAVRGLYAAADGILDVADLFVTTMTEGPISALKRLAGAIGGAANEVASVFETKETRQAREDAASDLAKKNLDKLQTPTSNAGGLWPQATYGWPFEKQARYNPVPGFSMFNVPNFANIEPTPSLRAATPEERKMMHEVRGEAQIEVRIDDQGLFQQIKKLITLLPTTQSGGGLENSTGRHTPTIPQ